MYHFQERIGLGSVVQGGKSKSLLLSELCQELGAQRDRLNKRMQGTLLNAVPYHSKYKVREKFLLINISLYLDITFMLNMKN